MARRLQPEEESSFFEAVADSVQSPGEDSAMSQACLRRKEDTPLPISFELAEWRIEHQLKRFPF